MPFLSDLFRSLLSVFVKVKMTLFNVLLYTFFFSPIFALSFLSPPHSWKFLFPLSGGVLLRSRLWCPSSLVFDLWPVFFHARHLDFSCSFPPCLPSRMLSLLFHVAFLHYCFTFFLTWRLPELGLSPFFPPVSLSPWFYHFKTVLVSPS